MERVFMWRPVWEGRAKWHRSTPLSSGHDQRWMSQSSWPTWLTFFIYRWFANVREEETREYLFGGRDNRSDLRGTTRLVGSSQMIISSVANPPCESLLKLLYESTCTEVPTIVVLWPVVGACYVVALVCCVEPCKGVDTTKNVILLASIGLSTGLCISDSLKTTSKLSTTCLFLGSQSR